MGDGGWRAVEVGTGLHRAALSQDSRRSAPQAWLVFAAHTSTPSPSACFALTHSLSLSLSRLSRLSLSLSLESLGLPPLLLYLQISLNECLAAPGRPRVVRAILASSLSGTPFVAFFTRCRRAPPPGMPALPREAATCRHRDPRQPIGARVTAAPAGRPPPRRATRARGSRRRANQRPTRVNVNLAVTPFS